MMHSPADGASYYYTQLAFCSVLVYVVIIKLQTEPATIIVVSRCKSVH